jgi:CheY-like chemotaxis protein
VDLVSDPGRGTTVTILLPPTDAPVPPVKPRTGGGKRGSETILVVEDEESVRRLATRALERLGYRVLLARDGAEGLELYRRNRDAISLILTDVVMPRMGGQELVDAVRKEGGSTRILFTSGYTSRSDRTSSGIDPEAPFLPKPWTIEELAGTIRQVLDA